MAGRCGCAGTCGCLLQAGHGITVTGAGTSIQPWVVSTSGPGTCVEVADCVGQQLGAGLVYDPNTHTIAVKISQDGGNVTGYGSDGGVFTPPSSEPGTNAIIATDTPEIVHNGDGAMGNPLSHALTGHRYGNWTVHQGGVFVGQQNTADAYTFTAYRAYAGDLAHWYGLSIFPTELAGDGAAIQVLDSVYPDAVAWTYVLDNEGQITAIEAGTAPVSARYRPMPWATAVISVNAALGQPGSTTITFPAGRFTHAPACFANTHTSAWFANVMGITTAGATVSMRHYDNTPSSGTVATEVFVIQHNPTSTVGLAAPTLVRQRLAIGPGQTVQATPCVCTCASAAADCDNGGVPVTVLVPEPVASAYVVCGVCEQPITDVVPVDDEGV